ncbi:hypothetical protein RB595_003487 [Gaeumannomyces hyphopodioides]
MRTTLFSPVGLFTLLLVFSFVHAESELAHAIERIFWWSQYQLEGYVFPNRPAESHWVGPDCIKPPKTGRCDFNEFVSWITRGKLDRAPDVLGKHPPSFFTNPQSVVEVAQRMAKIPDPELPRDKLNALYMERKL